MVVPSLISAEFGTEWAGLCGCEGESLGRDSCTSPTILLRPDVFNQIQSSRYLSAQTLILAYGSDGTALEFQAQESSRCTFLAN